jgi:cytochrome c oxidase cbb3-type subunit 3
VRRPYQLALALFLATACDQKAADLREWRPSDHDHTDNPGNNQVEGGPDAGAELAKHGLNDVVIVTWEQNCVRCHGSFGRGDGPQGPMVRAADLASPRLASVADADLLKVIRDGRGLMPAFPLPEPTLDALVRLIRLLGQATAAAGDSAGPAPSGAPSAAPSARPTAASSAHPNAHPSPAPSASAAPR